MHPAPGSCRWSPSDPGLACPRTTYRKTALLRRGSFNSPRADPTPPGNHSVTATLEVEGTLNGTYDSSVSVAAPIPRPSITSLSPASGPAGTAVTIAGTNFGATRGTSTVSFNGAPVTPTS